jgi:transposase
VLVELMVEHQAGIPLLMPPRSGHSRDAQACGQGIRASIAQVPTTDGATSLVADSALDRAATLHTLAQTAMPWMSRVPATLREAQAALAQGDLQALAALQAGYRDHELTSTDGGRVQRGVLIDAERRQPQAQRTVARPLRQQRDQEVNAWKQ